MNSVADLLKLPEIPQAFFFYVEERNQFLGTRGAYQIFLS